MKNAAEESVTRASSEVERRRAVVREAVYFGVDRLVCCWERSHLRSHTRPARHRRRRLSAARRAALRERPRHRRERSSPEPDCARRTPDLSRTSACLPPRSAPRALQSPDLRARSSVGERSLHTREGGGSKPPAPIKIPAKFHILLRVARPAESETPTGGRRWLVPTHRLAPRRAAVCGPSSVDASTLSRPRAPCSSDLVA